MADLAENVGIVVMLTALHDRPITIAAATVVLTTVKSAAFGLTLLAVAASSLTTWIRSQRLVDAHG